MGGEGQYNETEINDGEGLMGVSSKHFDQAFDAKKMAVDDARKPKNPEATEESK
jgi:hypothetical protein